MEPNPLLEKIEERIEELRPLHEEFLALSRALDQMKRFSVTNGSNITPKDAEQETEGQQDRPTIEHERHDLPAGQNAAKNETANAVKSVIREHPEGISVSEIAEAIGRKPSYVYTVTSRLIDRNLARREKRKIYPSQRLVGTR